MTLATIINSPEFLNNDRLRVTGLSLIVSEYQHLSDRTCTEILLADTERDILGTVFGTILINMTCQFLQECALKLVASLLLTTTNMYCG